MNEKYCMKVLKENIKVLEELRGSTYNQDIQNMLNILSELRSHIALLETCEKNKKYCVKVLKENIEVLEKLRNSSHTQLFKDKQIMLNVLAEIRYQIALLDACERNKI